jgi:hypothetical protein
MLFDFHREQEVGFWMQNTYIPLDMIFIRGDGRILHVVRWDEIRAVLVDPARREALVMVPGGGGFPVRGAPRLGGVGLEHFHAFVEMLPDYTSAPIHRPEHPARRDRGGPDIGSPVR